VVVLTVSSGPAQPATSTVPDVTGASERDATSKLKAAGFVSVSEQAYSDTVPSGSVVKQSPPAGSVYEQGGKVTITVSAGKLPFSAVPDVMGQAETDAVAALDQAGFKSTTTKGFDDAAPVGQVIGQTPPGGVFATNGLKVALVLSEGPAPSQAVTVPDVGGKTQDEATTVLEAAGFKVEVLEVYSDSVPAKSVAGQAPAAGGSTVKGATVTIAVSQGPTPTTPPTR
jgi:serine/threonine-protein kinase